MDYPPGSYSQLLLGRNVKGVSRFIAAGRRFSGLNLLCILPFTAPAGNRGGFRKPQILKRPDEEARPMANAQASAKQVARLFYVLVLLWSGVAGLSAVWAQYPAQYPASSQVTKDGTAVLVEDYANPPLSSYMRTGTYPPPIDFQAM